MSKTTDSSRTFDLGPAVISLYAVSVPDESWTRPTTPYTEPSPNLEEMRRIIQEEIRRLDEEKEQTRTKPTYEELQEHDLAQTAALVSEIDNRKELEAVIETLHSAITYRDTLIDAQSTRIHDLEKMCRNLEREINQLSGK